MLFCEIEVMSAIDNDTYYSYNGFIDGDKVYAAVEKNSLEVLLNEKLILRGEREGYELFDFYEFITVKGDLEKPYNLAIFIVNELYGYVDIQHGKIIIPAQFTYAKWFHNEKYAMVCYSDDRTGYIDMSGQPLIIDDFDDKIILYCLYNGIFLAAKHFDDGSLCCGAIDDSGKIIIDFEWDMLTLPVSDDYDNCYYATKGKRYYALNESGKINAEIKYPFDDTPVFTHKKCSFVWDAYIDGDIYWVMPCGDISGLGSGGKTLEFLT